MGGGQAAKTLMQIQLAGLKSQDKEISKEEENQILSRIKESYDKQASPYYAAARLWVDGVIDPVETRRLISEGIKAADNNPDMERFSTGVFQV